MRLYPYQKKEVLTKYDFVCNGVDEYNRIPVMKDRKWGAIDKDGVEVISPQYDSISKFENGYAKVKIDGNVGIIDENGKKIVPVAYQDVIIFDVCFVVEDIAGKGVYNKKGTSIIERDRAVLDIESCTPYIKVFKRSPYQGYWGLYDTEGNEVVPAICDRIHMEENTIVVTIDGMEGIYNPKETSNDKEQ